MQGRKYFTLKILLEHPQAITQLISKSGPSWARQRNAIIGSPARWCADDGPMGNTSMGRAVVSALTLIP